MEETNKTISQYDLKPEDMIGVNRINTYNADKPEWLRNRYTSPDQSQRLAHVNPNAFNY